MTTPLPSPTPSNLGGAPFKGHPQKFPRAQRKAAQVAAHVHTIIRKSPRTLIATVADTSFQVTMGYVTCTTEQGVVSVYGVPYGACVAGMRLYARQQGPQGTNRAFVFDGFAPALSARGLSSGSVIYATPSSFPTVGVYAVTSAGGMPTTPSLATGPVGYYWHCYFYFPALPTTARATLFQMTSAGGNLLTCEYLPSGILLLRSVENNHGYMTTAPVAPHSAHWMVVQPGQGVGLDWQIDGIAVPYVGLLSSGDLPVFTSNGAAYTGALLSNVDGTQLCPLGSWISKFGFGTSYTGGAVAPLAVASAVPDDDSLLPNLNISATQQTQTLLLCTDTPGGFALANSATGSSGSGATVLGPPFQIIAPGPY